jgi:8-oxo-dGTP diphosphatase
VVVHDGRVLLIRRAKEPLRGRWLVPGGTVEWGEALAPAVEREVFEETGVRVRAGAVVAVVEHIDPPGQEAAHHFVIVDYLCQWLAGEPRAGSDALEAEWVGVEDLPGRDLPEKAREVVAEGLRRLGLLGYTFK